MQPEAKIRFYSCWLYKLQILPSYIQNCSSFLFSTWCLLNLHAACFESLSVMDRDVPVSLKFTSMYHKNISYFVSAHSLSTNLNSMGERRNESKIYVLLIQGGSVFITEVSFIPAWESCKVQMFKGLCFNCFACINHVWAKLAFWLSLHLWNTVVLELPVYYSINRGFRDNTAGNKTKTTKPNNPNSAVNMSERKKKRAIYCFYKN